MSKQTELAQVADTITVDSGNVGIKTSSPSADLDVASSNATIHLTDTDDTTYAEIRNNGGTFTIASDEGAAATNSSINFRVDGSEAMRLDSSGNLLVGTTDNAVWNDTSGTGGINARSDGILAAARNGGEPLLLNRIGTDGELIKFKKDGSDVGIVGCNGGYIFVGKDDVNLRFHAGANAVLPTNSGGSSRDNAIDLGSSGARFDDIYATNGTIQTSDRNEKQDIAELSDAEQRVAIAAKGLLRKFRWRDSVEEKGDEARTHFGIIAQDLQAAFAAEGLDAGDYAMFIHTTWTDEETGEERTRMGVRYSELLAFIIAAI